MLDRGTLGTTPKAPALPLLDPNAPTEITVAPVRFAPLLRTGADQLVFSVTSVYGGGMQGMLAVVDVAQDRGQLAYVWMGDAGLGPWRIVGNTIRADVNYFAAGDSECCPTRLYRFAVGVRNGSLTEIADDRPFLGVIVNSGLSVVEVEWNAPAAGRLRLGDVLLEVRNAPPWPEVRRNRSDARSSVSSPV